jgi:Tol biopolymer transport system component
MKGYGEGRMKVITEHQAIEIRKVISILETVEIESGKRTVLKEFDYLIEAPNWLKNGKELIYNANGLIYSYDITSGVSTLIPTSCCNQCNNDHVLSPDHLQLAVSHRTYEDGQSRIYTIPVKGGTPVLVTPIAPSYLHGWSPDGKTLVYCAERNGEYDIYSIPAVGGRETRLTDAPGLDDGPEYSPDGKYIWFNSVRSGLMQLWRMKADGSEQTQMTFDESNSWFAHLSPDGTTVAYITYQKGDVAPGDHPANKNVEIRLMPSTGGPYRTLVKLFGGQGTLNVNSWSPCGKHLAFVSYRLVE